MPAGSAYAEAAAEESKLVTLRAGRQAFGIPVRHVRDVLKQARITPVPLAPPEALGVMNLRGRIVLVIDLRVKLALPPPEEDAAPMFAVVEHEEEYFALRVDGVGEVLGVADGDMTPPPPNLPPAWRQAAAGVCRLPDELLVVIDVAALLAPQGG